MNAKFKIKWRRFLLAFAITSVFLIGIGKAMSADAPTNVTAALKAAGAEPAKPAPVRTALPLPTTQPALAAASSGDASNSVAKVTDADAAAVMPKDYDAPTFKAHYGRLDALRADTDMANAEIENLKVRHQLDEARKGNFQSDTPAPQQSGMSTFGMPTAPLIAPSDPSPRGATVETTSMSDDRWIAQIRLPSGVYVNKVQVGQTLPGVGKVVSISLNEVLVASGGRTTSIPFSHDDGVSQGASALPASARGMTVAPPIPTR